MNEPCKIITLRDFYVLQAAAAWLETTESKGTAKVLRSICERATTVHPSHADDVNIKLPENAKGVL